MYQLPTKARDKLAPTTNAPSTLYLALKQTDRVFFHWVSLHSTQPT